MLGHAPPGPVVLFHEPSTGPTPRPRSPSRDKPCRALPGHHGTTNTSCNPRGVFVHLQGRSDDRNRRGAPELQHSSVMCPNRVRVVGATLTEPARAALPFPGGHRGQRGKLARPAHQLPNAQRQTATSHAMQLESAERISSTTTEPPIISVSPLRRDSGLLDSFIFLDRPACLCCEELRTGKVRVLGCNADAFRNRCGVHPAHVRLSYRLLELPRRLHVKPLRRLELF